MTWNWRERAEDIHNTAVDKGWWDDPRDPDEVYALFHSEVSEALEAYRKVEDWKPAFTEELADIVIRILDWAFADEERWYGFMVNDSGEVLYLSRELARDPKVSKALNRLHRRIANAYPRSAADPERSYAPYELHTAIGVEGWHLRGIVDFVVEIAAGQGLDLRAALDAKQEKNRNRERRHGGLRC